MKAVKDRVFIKLDLQEKTETGIFLPESIERPRTIGCVIAIGPEVKSVQIGDRVLFHVFDELPSYEKDVVVVRENSILGVFEQ